MKIFIAVFLMEFLVCVEASSMIPLMTYLADFFNIRVSSIQYVNLGYFLVGGLVPIFGMIGDKKGNKIVINISLIFLALGAYICGVAKSSILYAIGRTFSGASYIILNAVLISYISSFTDYNQRGKAAGIIKLAFGCGMVIGPIAGTFFVSNYSIRTFYWILSFLTMLVFVISIGLPNNRLERGFEEKISFRKQLGILKKPEAAKIIISLALFLTALYFELNYLSIWLNQRFKLNIQEIGRIYTINSIGTILGIVACIYLSDKIGKHRFAIIFKAIMGLAVILLQFQSNIYLVVILTFIIMLGTDGAITVVQALGSEVFPENRTFFMTLITFSISIGGVIASIIGPSIYELGGFSLNLRLSSILILISILVYSSLSKDKNLMERLGEKKVYYKPLKKMSS